MAPSSPPGRELSAPQAERRREPDAVAARPTGSSPAQVLALQRAVGNRGVGQLIQRASAKGPESPKAAESGTAAPQKPHPRTASIQQVREPNVVQRPADPQLVERARQFRVQRDLLKPNDFRRNVVVIKFERDGKIDFAVTANDELHGEIEAIAELEHDDPHWRRTQIHEIYTEREPCGNCGPNLRATRVRLNNIAVEQGREPLNFRVYFTVPQSGTWGERRALLQAQYLPPEAGGGGPTAGGAMFSFVAQVWLAALHQDANERRAGYRAAASPQGYAPPGSHGGALERAGDVMYDPMGTGDRSIPLRSRVYMPTWRAFVRRHFGWAKPGDVRVFRWDHIDDERTDERYVVYLLGNDRRWYSIGEQESLGSAEWLASWMREGGRLMAADPKRYERAPSPHTPDINQVLDTKIPDELIWSLIEIEVNKYDTDASGKPIA